jgi:hypothetical protein
MRKRETLVRLILGRWFRATHPRKCIRARALELFRLNCDEDKTGECLQGEMRVLYECMTVTLGCGGDGDH